MNVWNFRSTYYDLRLMIEENSPDARNPNPQQAALANVLFTEIGRCCRDIFHKARANPLALQPPSAAEFRLDRINCYWLLAPLIHACPMPEAVSSNITASNIQASFLKEAASMLEISKGWRSAHAQVDMKVSAFACRLGDYEAQIETRPLSQRDSRALRTNQCSAWLLSQQPFVDLVLVCVDSVSSADELVGALLKQLQVRLAFARMRALAAKMCARNSAFQDIVVRVKETPTLPSRHVFTHEREGLILRLNLIGGMFDTLMALNTESLGNWVLVLFQLLFYGVLSPERDR